MGSAYGQPSLPEERSKGIEVVERNRAARTGGGKEKAPAKKAPAKKASARKAPAKKKAAKKAS